MTSPPAAAGRPPGGRLLVVLLTAVVFVLGGPPARVAFADRGADRLRRFEEQQAALKAKLADRLERLARDCEDSGLPDAADAVRRRAQPADADAMGAERLPARLQPPIPADLPAEEQAWRQRLRSLEQEHAKELYLLSRNALYAGFANFAWQLVREVARYNPDHPEARRLLGYVRDGERWLTPFARQQRRSRQVWHETYGWLPQDHVPRYERGERYYKRWMSAEQEAEIRRDFNHAWEVRTEHFLVKTNHSLERGVEIAAALEAYHEFFLQTFAAFFNTPEQIRALMTGAAGGARRAGMSRPYEVHYYRTRDEYNRRLIAKIPQIGVSTGLYYMPDRISYFFHDPLQPEEAALATVYHEATHQFLYENSPRDRPIAEHENFWITEGIACYMESFHSDGERVSLGDPRYIRFAAARSRYLNDEYYVPLAQFTAMGRVEFQGDPNLATNYSQASGLAHFFMHYRGGRYREALIEHLAQVYAPDRRSRPQSLAELTGVRFDELDRQYGEYMQRMEEAVRRRQNGLE